ncbi:type III-B CRISPR module-associated protein Cmr5 [Bacillus methanolicus]|uniref:type III-B CRISPR module-associated protein Cmr5 n=1 Tax=Bacillus methanolicus TaxID=1471 RepID=UPI00238099D5|nr:type III-B CRISPR module-associated protein Cmr5 [Bacillus methanolicus]MDE3840935.1 type III-B CRISPR module-associated protein Cmr5 [Bacillus methanolicus]
MAAERVGIENGRASFAFESVKNAFEDNRVSFESYRSYVKKLPSLIQINGLGQALAFCYQKGKEYRVIYDQLHTWLKDKYGQYFQEQNKEFVEVVIGLKSADYRVLTMEVLALLNWMRKFADGMAK